MAWTDMLEFISGPTNFFVNKKVKEIKDIQDRIDYTKRCNESNISRYQHTEVATSIVIDNLGEAEIDAQKTFKKFCDLFEKIKNRPGFKEIEISRGIDLKPVDFKNLSEASIGASAYVGALGEVALGVMLSPAGWLFGNIFSFGGSIKQKADEAHREMKQNEQKIDEICDYLNRLKSIASNYLSLLQKVVRIYVQHLKEMEYIIDVVHRVDATEWGNYSVEERKIIENTTLLAKVVYNMCKVKLVKAAEKDGGFKELNTCEIKSESRTAHRVIDCVKNSASMNFFTNSNSSNPLHAATYSSSCGVNQSSNLRNSNPSIGVEEFKSIFREAIVNERENRVLFDWDKIHDIVNRITGRQYSENKLRELVSNFGRKDHVNVSEVAKQIDDVLRNYEDETIVDWSQWVDKKIWDMGKIADYGSEAEVDRFTEYVISNLRKIENNKEFYSRLNQRVYKQAQQVKDQIRSRLKYGHNQY